MSKPRLIYFDAPVSRGEECRLALHLAGIDFEDVRIKSADWPALKERMPYGSLPVLELPGKPALAHSNAILVLVGVPIARWIEQAVRWVLHGVSWALFSLVHLVAFVPGWAWSRVRHHGIQVADPGWSVVVPCRAGGRRRSEPPDRCPPADTHPRGARAGRGARLRRGVDLGSGPSSSGDDRCRGLAGGLGNPR